MGAAGQRFESLEQRMLLSGWGVQLVGRVQAPLNGGPAPFGGDPVSNPVVDHAGNVFVWEDNLILEMPAGQSQFIVAGDLSALPEPDGMSFPGHSDLQIDNAGNIFGVRWNADPGIVERFELPAGSSTIELVSRDGPGAGIPFGTFGTQFGPVQIGDRRFVIAADGVSVLDASGNVTLLPFDPADGTTLQGFGSAIADKQGDLIGSRYVYPENGPGRVEIFEVPAGTNSVITLAKLDPSLGEEVGGLAVDDAGAIYGVAQNFYVSIPEGPYDPPSVATLFKVVPQTTQDTLVLDAPPVVGSDGHLSVTVKAIAPDGSVDTSITADVTLQISSGPGGDLAGTLTGQMIDGVVTFSDVTLPSWGRVVENLWFRETVEGARYVLGANADGFATGFSGDIDVTPPADPISIQPILLEPPLPVTDPPVGGTPPSPDPSPVVNDPVVPAPVASDGPKRVSVAAQSGLNDGVAAVAAAPVHVSVASSTGAGVSVASSPALVVLTSVAAGRGETPAAAVVSGARFDRGYMLGDDGAGQDEDVQENGSGAADGGSGSAAAIAEQGAVGGSAREVQGPAGAGTPVAAAGAVDGRAAAARGASRAVVHPLRNARSMGAGSAHAPADKMGFGGWGVLGAVVVGLVQRRRGRREKDAGCGTSWGCVRGESCAHWPAPPAGGGRCQDCFDGGFLLGSVLHRLREESSIVDVSEMGRR